MDILDKKFVLPWVPMGSQVKALADKRKRDDELVMSHDGSCNDYTGCNSGCVWVRRGDAEYRAGAYRS